MSELTSWDWIRGDSFRVLDLVHNRLSRLLADIDGALDHSVRASPAIDPRTDITADKENLYYLMELPGVDPEDVRITASNGVLTIYGHKHRQESRAGNDYRSIERSFGEFTRTFTVPDGTDPDQIDASLENGVLEIRIPLPQASIPAKEIKIGTSSKKTEAVKTNGHQPVVS